MVMWRICGTVGVIVVSTLCACSGTRKAPPGLGAPTDPLVTTPSFYTPYYSTQKARTLGETYSENLDRLVEQVLQSSVGKQQFANSIVSISLGFFTYSSSRPPDERYLEALLGLPDILDANDDVSLQLDKLFSQYGRELLSVLSQDKTIAEDAKVAGYGLNFSWRSVRQTPSGPRLSLDGGVIYVRKDKTQRFLNRQIEQDELLATSILFARQGDQSARRIRYSAPPPSAISPAAAAALPADSAPAVVVASQVGESVKENPPVTESPFVVALPAPATPVEDVSSVSAPPPSDEPEKEALANKQDPVVPASAPVDHRDVPDVAPNPQPAPLTPVEGGKATPLSPSPQPGLKPEQLFDSQLRGQKQTVAVAPNTSLPSQPSPERVADGQYLVLLSFAELLEALRWSNALGDDGYSVTRDFPRESREIRLRVGSFRSFADADRFLKDVKSQGVNGQVLQIGE